MVSYVGVSGCLRAIVQLRLVFADRHAVPIRDTVSFPLPRRQFDSDGRPRRPESAARSATKLLDQLGWWARALRDARVAHPYGG